jgi:hypothetical protein
MVATPEEAMSAGASEIALPAFTEEALVPVPAQATASGHVESQPPNVRSTDDRAFADTSYPPAPYEGDPNDPNPIALYSPVARAHNANGALSPADFPPAPLPSVRPTDRPTARLSTRALAVIVTPRSTPILLAVAGGAFWTWAFGIMVWFCTLPLRHVAEPIPPAATAVAVATSSVRAVASAEPAVLAAAAPAKAPVAVPAPAPSHAPGPDPTADSNAVAPGAAPFRAAAAVRSLDAKWRDIAKCRRGKVWGKAPTTVTFAGDGSVAHVDVGPPFTDTPTADCISDALSSVRVEPFGDKTAELIYRVYVAPR